MDKGILTHLGELHRATLLREMAARLCVQRAANLVEVSPDDAILKCGSHRARTQPPPRAERGQIFSVLTCSTALPRRRPAAVPEPSMPSAELDEASQVSVGS